MLNTDQPWQPVPVEGPSQETKGGTETILLAEDKSMILELCKTLREELSYTVLTARSHG